MIRIATRKSALAKWQANHVAARLAAADPSLTVVLKEFLSQGDKILDVPLAQVGGKGLFVKEIEDALLRGDAEVAVHSMKDLPTLIPDGLILAAVPEREDPRDALCSRSAKSIAGLRRGARVGTSSLRRGAQLKALRPDLEIVSIRGNVETRLRKLDEGLDAVVLALAGLRRLGLEARVTAVIPPEELLPAVAQGALAIETRAGDAETLARVAKLDHLESRQRVLAERALLRRMEGSCQVPIAAHAVVEGARLSLRALVASLDGTQVVRGEKQGKAVDAERIGADLAEDMLARGAAEILAALKAAP